MKCVFLQRAAFSLLHEQFHFIDAVLDFADLLFCNILRSFFHNIEFQNGADLHNLQKRDLSRDNIITDIRYDLVERKLTHIAVPVAKLKNISVYHTPDCLADYRSADAHAFRKRPFCRELFS